MISSTLKLHTQVVFRIGQEQFELAMESNWMQCEVVRNYVMLKRMHYTMHLIKNIGDGQKMNFRKVMLTCGTKRT